MTTKTFDVMWLIEAAGDDSRKLAQAGLMLAAMSMMTYGDSSEHATDVLYNVTLAMDAIADKMHLPKSTMMSEFRKRVRS